MIPHPNQGSLPMFRFRGIQVSLHWSWLLVAVYQIQQKAEGYNSPIWAVAEYLGLFFIVLLHEFGHSFATRQVGGKAENILLWPFGGIAFVNAPPRPGAHLWSIAAGPLVNVALVPVFWLMTRYVVPDSGSNDALSFANRIQYINIGLLIFNILPIYPLDGGQIFQALLWFKMGYPRALLIASGVGLLGGAVLMAWVFDYTRSLLPVLLVGFLLGDCWKAFQAARAMLSGQDPPPH